MVKSSHGSRVASPPASSPSVVKGGAVRKRPQKRAGHRCGEARASWCRGKLRKPGSGSAASKSDDKGSKAMDDSSTIELEQFLTSGRTGRRNAMPQITDPNQAGLSTADLPLDLAKLSCSERTGADNSGQAGSGSPQGSKPSS